MTAVTASARALASRARAAHPNFEGDLIAVRQTGSQLFGLQAGARVGAKSGYAGIDEARAAATEISYFDPGTVTGFERDGLFYLHKTGDSNMLATENLASGVAMGRHSLRTDINMAGGAGLPKQPGVFQKFSYAFVNRDARFMIDATFDKRTPTYPPVELRPPGLDLYKIPYNGSTDPAIRMPAIIRAMREPQAMGPPIISRGPDDPNPLPGLQAAEAARRGLPRPGPAA